MVPLFCVMTILFFPSHPPTGISQPFAFFCFLLLSPLFSHQSLQGMLSSLHSELDIQRYLMKIQLPHRVSRPFILSASCHCVCVAMFASSLTSALRPCVPTLVPPNLRCLLASGPAKPTWLGRAKPVLAVKAPTKCQTHLI